MTAGRPTVRVTMVDAAGAPPRSPLTRGAPAPSGLSVGCYRPTAALSQDLVRFTDTKQTKKELK